ncbi:MAG TPA: hypothetical protein VGL81_04750 [Polyangiaceae bacterium]|jgi:hypothetical protein
MFRLRLALSVALVLAATLVPAVAAAQTVSASGQPYPNRIVNGSNLGYSTRPQNLNPLGVSYTDCTSDMTLQFSVTLTGFAGSDSLEVWASLTSDCTASTDRGIGAGVTALCWGLRAGNITNPIIMTPQTYSFNVRVQDLVGWQSALPSAAEAANPPAQGASACTAQATFAAVPINVNFLAIDSSGNSDGTPYQYTINTDMVGPPAPSGVGETVGETLYNVTWTANSDSDTAGYDVFMDPIPGKEGAEAGAISSEAGQVMVCPETGAASTPDATSGSGDDGSTDGPLETSSVVDASEASVAPLPYDGGCYYINKGGQSPPSANGYTCNDSILASGITQDGGIDGGDAEVVATPVLYDEAGDIIEGGSVEEGVGGISTIPTQYLLNGSSGFTIADKSVGSYQVKGLIDGVTYTAVVASVDGTGNIGPPSLEVCDYPAPVRDFWQTYREDGGQGGGFCALQSVGAGGASSLAGVAGVLGFAAVLRRRRRSKK